jgi:hypothetical protein
VGPGRGMRISPQSANGVNSGYTRADLGVA